MPDATTYAGLQSGQAYPERPGFRVPGTSEEAADAIRTSGRADTLNARTLASLKRSAKSPEEVAEELGENILSIRPRFSGLSALGLIVKTPERRKSACGRSTTVWAAVCDPLAASLASQP